MLAAFLKELYSSRELILELARRDMRQQNQGAFLGIVWMFLQPLLFIAVLYGVFTWGLRVGESGPIPFSVYLVSGMVFWLFFSSNLSTITGVVRSYSFLVKKMQFRHSVLPVVKLLSSLLPHAFLVLVAVVIAAIQGIYPGWHTLQFIYYLFCSIIVLLGLGWITSSTSVFVRDVSNLVGVVVQFGFWLTPIFWHIERVPRELQWILQLNPACYLVNGYRDAITGAHYFWERPVETAIFWSTALVLFTLGMHIYKRLSPHFAEVI